MTDLFDDPDEEDHLLIGAMGLYKSLHKALREAISLLEDANEPEGTAKAVGETIKSHRKALQSIIDIEVDLGKRNKNGAASSIELDMDAARAEIIGRVARLRDAGNR